MSYEKLFDLTHKVALVAGAAGGLARETCLGLNQFGATLALADVDAKGLTRVCNELGRKGIKTWSKVVDVSDGASVESLINALKRNFGRLDILINFVGVVWTNPIEKISVAEFQKVIDINLKGSFLLAQQSLRLMAPKRSGKIILVGSVYEEASKAIKRARAGKGPTLLECLIHRWTGHSMSDPDTYRTEKEKREGEKKDPILRFKKELISEGRMSEDEYMEMEQRVAKEIEEAIHFAEKECTDIDPEPFDILRGVYAAN